MSHGIPIPRKTFTLLDPVTLPMDASALSSASAAALEAKVSGRDVPNATRVMAVTESLRPMTQPNIDARSPIMAVTAPMKMSATLKHTHPPP